MSDTVEDQDQRLIPSNVLRSIAWRLGVATAAAFLASMLIADSGNPIFRLTMGLWMVGVVTLLSIAIILLWRDDIEKGYR